MNIKKTLLTITFILLAGAGCNRWKNEPAPTPLPPDTAQVQTRPAVDIVEGEDRAIGLSFEYPETYVYFPSHDPRFDSVVWMTVKSIAKPDIRLELWDSAELADRPFGFEGGEEDREEAEKYLPEVSEEIIVGDKTYYYFIFNQDRDPAVSADFVAVLASLKAVQ